MYKRLILRKQEQFANHLSFSDILNEPQKAQLYYPNHFNTSISSPLFPLPSTFVVSFSYHFSFRFFFIFYPAVPPENQFIEKGRMGMELT